MFVVPFLRYKFDCDLLKLKDLCFSEKEKDRGRVISNVGGWQSNVNPLNLNLFSELKKIVSDFSLHVGMPGDMEIISHWININDHRSFNRRHRHNDAVWSAVLYVQVPNNSGDIRFYNPAHDQLNYEWSKVNQLTHFNSPCWTIAPNPGDLFIFPAWLDHEVEPNMNQNEERISIAFNFD